jgi:mono/diheme cytochrome c family protein
MSFQSRRVEQPLWIWTNCILLASIALIRTATAAVDFSKLPATATRAVEFAKDVQPILEKSCLRCHNSEKAKGKFLLDTREHALKGGDNGVDIVVGDSAKSPLIHFTARLVEDSEMPPLGKGEALTKEQVGILRAWIDQGAKWPEEVVLRSREETTAESSKEEKVTLPPAATRKVDFVKDIQPIFTARCYECHAEKKQEAQFRLDAKEIALKGGELGPAIVPGKSDESLLIRAVAGVKPDFVMPKQGERLTTEQIGLLRAWIDQGAEWPDSASVKLEDKRNHWAFKPPVRPPVPTVKLKKWTKSPIDNFVLTRLEQEHLKPAPEADRSTLIRRLSLDLIGLPPSLKEVQEFVADKRPDAYERVVERLLASPHYGERWGRHWLDAARYADTNGYEKDKPRSIWPYRDWVIKAFNDDLPFDEFTIDQLAGDLLPNPTLDQRVATGFLRNSMLNQEGGIEPEQFRVEALIDRMDTLGKAFLGLTINCCQCHNHKYDPFAQKEYYQLYAFLNNDDEAFLEVPTPEQEKQRSEILAKVRALEEKAMKEATNLTARMAEWETNVSEVTTDWSVLDPKEWLNFATKYEKQEDSSLLGGGDLQPGGVMRVWVDTELTNITGFRLEALTNPNLMYGGPGLGGKGSFLVKEFSVEAYPLHEPTVTNKIEFWRAEADEESPGFGISKTIDGKSDKGGWSPTLTVEHRNEPHRAVFECREPFGFPGGTRMEIVINQTKEKDDESKLESHMLGCLRLSVTTNAETIKVDPLTPEQRKLLAIAPEKRTPAQKLELFEAFRLADTNFASLNRQIENVFTNWPYPPTTLVLQQREHPRVTHIFKRGDRSRPGDEVQPDVPAILNPFPKDAPRNRLGLAKWVVDRRSPTTARVIVNRMWQEYFGQGLVTTPEDFGTRVERPSHPELLDWLACEFMGPKFETRNSKFEASSKSEESVKPWSMKHIHRLIVTSATYRQSSKLTPENYTKDQYNRLLARGPRLRVDGEVVEDIALSVSGLLNPKIGGPSIYPPIPASVGDQVYGGFTWPETKGADRFRRGMYTFSKRSLPFPSLTAFDTPSGEFSCPRRVRSNTPLQALTTLNEKTFVEAAQAMALRVIKEGGSDNRSRAVYAFELCTGRQPSGFELNKLLKFWQEQYDYFENRTASAVNVAVPDPKQMPEDVNLHKVAAWAMVSRAILNLDETITKE